MVQTLKLVIGNTDLKMDRRKTDDLRERKEWPEGWGKSNIAGDESPKLKKRRIHGPKFHKEIQIRTKNSSLDNTSQRLTLQRAVGTQWWWQMSQWTKPRRLKGSTAQTGTSNSRWLDHSRGGMLSQGRDEKFSFELRTLYHLDTVKDKNSSAGLEGQVLSDGLSL